MYACSCVFVRVQQYKCDCVAPERVLALCVHMHRRDGTKVEYDLSLKERSGR